MEFALLILVVVFGILLLRLKGQVSDLAEGRARDERAIAELTRRIWRLEGGVAPTPAPEPLPKPQPLPVIQAAPEPLPEPEPEPSPAPVVEAPKSVRRLPEEWEAVVGGSWLNKLGALVLVIGIALLYRYSLASLGPAGKIGVGVLTGVLLLGGGIWLERRERYRVFAGGLVAAAWAILYFTAFAAHAIPEARVIENPTLGLFALLAVAGLMVGHSLSYESEAVTGVAFFAAFAALQIHPKSIEAEVASAVLAAGLLWVAHRKGWERLALAGALFVYGTFIVNGAGASFVRALGQPVLWVHWLMFEAYGLAGKRSRALFPLNAFGFLMAQMLPGATAPAADQAAFLGLASAGFCGSGALRWRREVPATEADDAEVAFSAPGLAVTLAAVLFGAALARRYGGSGVALGWFLTAEALVTLGMLGRRRYFRYLGLAFVVIALARFVFIDVWHAGLFTLLSRRWFETTPMALLFIALCFGTRAWTGMRAFSWLGTALAALQVGIEIQDAYMPAGWLALGAVLLEVGIRKGWTDLKWQAGAMALLAAGLSAFAMGRPALAWGTPLAITALVTARLVLWPAEIRALRVSLWLMAGYYALWTWQLLPSPLVGPAWGLGALALVELGAAPARRELQRAGYALAALAFGRLFLANFTITGQTWVLSHRVLTVTPFLPLFYLLWWRAREAGARVARLFLWAPPVLALALVRFEIGRARTALGAVVLCLVLLFFGSRFRLPDLRWQAYLLGLAGFARALGTDFMLPGSLGGVPARVWTGVLEVAGFFTAHQMARRNQDVTSKADEWAPPGFALLGATLLAALLYHEVSGKVLTVAWGLEGVALLGAGFALRERVLRLSGLALFLFCVMKLFLYDLASLEGLARVISFIALGLLLLGASWLYSRFREQLRRYL